MPESILLDDLDIYRLANEVGDDIWKLVEQWSYFPRKTIGSQFGEAGDSIAANIAEGYGRFFYKDRRVFCYYARGSMMETRTWAMKSLQRKLMSNQEYENLLEKLKKLHYKLNIYIKKLKINISTGKEH